jgi:pyrroloquinoline-quinone synthase
LTLASLIDDVLADIDVRKNPFLCALADGSFTREDFLETQYQFYWAVTFFARPMAALAAKIPDASMRVEILRNVWEEHGEGDRAKMHGTTFREFLARLANVDAAVIDRELEKRPLWPEVRAFNTLLVGACVLDEYLVGAATMGIVERMFSEISSMIGRAVVARGFVAADQLVHYDVHETLDVRHAADFFDVLAPSYGGDRRSRYLIEQGLRMGAMSFDALYSRLYRCRERRWER